MQCSSEKAVPYAEIFLVIGIFAGGFLLASVNAVLNGFPAPSLSDGQALAMVAFELFMCAVAAAVLMARGWTRHDLLFRIDWFRSGIGIALFAATWTVHIAIWESAGTYLGGGDLLLEFRQAISLSLPIALVLSIVNGAFEEFFLTRYLVDRLTPLGPPIALGVSALVRLACHLYQGPVGAVSVLFFGIVLTAFYWRYRDIWPVMFAHITADFVAFI